MYCHYFCGSEGGFFNAIMSFPSNYPNSPPTVRFTSEMWHPNGSICLYVYITLLIRLNCNITFYLPSFPFLVGKISLLVFSLRRWEGLHFDSSSSWWRSEWLWACEWALESSPYGMYLKCIGISLPWLSLFL